MAKQPLHELNVGKRYRHIRLSFYKVNDKELEAKWVREVFSRNDERKYWILVNNHSGMRDALDSLLHIKCLWPGMRLSTIHKVFSMKGDELFMNYVRHIKSIWEYILNDNLGMMAKMDHISVRMVELLCPRVSADDARIMKRSRIGKYLNEKQRHLLKRRLLQVDTLVPSFRSLFEDLNYLDFLVNTIKKLHRPTTSEHSLSSSFQALTNDAQSTNKSLRKLFLYCMRNHQRVHAYSRDSGSDDASSFEMDVNEALLNYFATYAYDSGFTKIRAPSAPLPADGTKYDIKENRSPDLVTDQGGLSARGRRSGPPRKTAHSGYRGFLWIEHMEAPNDAVGENLTPFFIQKAFYNAFFGSWKRPSALPSDNKYVLAPEYYGSSMGVIAGTLGYNDLDSRFNDDNPATAINLLSDGSYPAADTPSSQYDSLDDELFGARSSQQTELSPHSTFSESDDLFFHDEPIPLHNTEVEGTGVGHGHGQLARPNGARENLKRPLPPDGFIYDTPRVGRDLGRRCSCTHIAKRQKVGGRSTIAGDRRPFSRPR